jgi:outer membrane protein assembly factor BamD (BamD/ComL family)
MVTQGSRTTFVVACAILFSMAGCQVPPPPAAAQRQVANSDDSEEGWLWRRLTGQNKAASEQPAAATSASPTPAAAPAASGPQFPANPTTQSQAAPASGVVQTSATQAGPGDVRQIGTSLSSVAAQVAKEEEASEGFDWSQLDPANMYKKMKAATGFGPDERLANGLFNEGLTLYREKRFTEAAEKFKKAADRWPDSTLEEDSLFFQAESYFFADQYGKSHDTLQILFKKYQNSRYLDVAVSREFSIGRYWEQTAQKSPHWPITPNFTDKTQPWFDTFGNAMNAYTAVRLNDPTGPLADDSIMATGNAYFVKERYEDACYHYDLLRKEYPKSEHQVQATVLALQSKRLVYQGPLYDGKPLDEADEIARQALTQYRNQLGNEQARITQVKTEIREEKARRDWAMAQFWETKRAYGAARNCYEAMMKEYAGTQLADMARERFEAIKDKPANPANYFKWLTSFFDMFKE